MRNKLIISTLLAAMLPVLPVLAAADLSETSAVLTENNNGVIVSGKVSEKVEEIIIKLSDTGDYAGAENAEDAEFKAVTVVDMSEKTEFERTLFFPAELATGRYYVYLSGKNVNDAKPIELWYQQEEDKAAMIAEIQAANETTMEATLFNNYDVLSDGKSYDRADKLGLKNEFYNDAYDAKVAALMVSNKSSDIAVLKNNFNIASAIAAFENKTFNWTESDKKLAVNIWADEDAAMGNAQKHFNDTLSANGRQNVINALSNGQTYQTFADFNKVFAREVIYNGIYNSDKEGIWHISTLISELKDVSGYDFSAYTSLSAEQQNEAGLKLLQAAATDFDDMTAKLSGIITEISQSTSTETVVSGGSGGGGGGGNPVISGTTPVYIPGVANTPEASVEFTDIDSVVWAKDAIEYLKEKNIVSGTGEGKFEPNRAVKREEFIKMLISALEIEIINTSADFSDVDANAWYTPYISTAVKMEITKGMGDGSFGVGMPITREQSCAFIYRACKDQDFSGEEKVFVDADEISEYAKESVKALSSAGIIVGDENGSFNPTDNITRAQTAVMIYRLISGGNA